MSATAPCRRLMMPAVLRFQDNTDHPFSCPAVLVHAAFPVNPSLTMMREIFEQMQLFY
jgi:hypothetical protein